MPWEVTDQFIRSGHGSLASLDKDSLRTIDISKDQGIKAVVGCPVGKYQGGSCSESMKTQSFLFSKEKGWDLIKAKGWFTSHKASDSLIPELKNLLNEQLTNTKLSENRGGELLMPEDKKKLEELEAKMQVLEDARTKEKEEFDSYKADMEAKEKSLEEDYKLQGENTKKALEDTSKRLEDAEKRLAERTKELRKEEIEKVTDKFLSEGIFPGVVNKAKAFMLADLESETSNLIKLTEVVDGKSVEKEVSFTDAISQILSEVPENARIDLSEHSKKTDQGGTSEEMTTKEVLAFANEHKLSYEDACVQLEEEGRIESSKL